MAESNISNFPVGMPITPFTMASVFKSIVGGKVYIGQPNTDPKVIANRLPVYVVGTDGSETEVPQPLNIGLGGFPLYQNRPANFIVKSKHSMHVYDAFNQLQHKFSTVDRTGGGGGGELLLWAYNNGDPVEEGVNEFVLPFQPGSVKTITINGTANYDGINYDYFPAENVIRLRNGETTSGGEVIICYLGEGSVTALIPNAIRGYNFTTGARLDSVNDHVYDHDTKQWYYWGGFFPKMVNPGDTPNDPNWISKGDNDTRTLTWAYNSGAPVPEGMTEFYIPFEVAEVPMMTVSGTINYSGVNYDFYPAEQKVVLRSGKTTGVERIVFHFNVDNIAGLGLEISGPGGIGLIGGAETQLATQDTLTLPQMKVGQIISVKTDLNHYNKYTIIPNSSVLGDGDVLVDRIDGTQLELQIDGVIDVRSFAKKGRSDQQVLKAATDYIKSKNGRWVLAITSKDKTGSPWIFESVTLPNDIILQGHGGRLKLRDNVCTDSSKNYYPINTLGSSNVTIDKIIVDGNMQNNSLFRVADTITIGGVGSRVINCEIYNSPDSGIMFTDASGGQIINNVISGGRDVGIYANSSSDETSRNNVINNNNISGFIYGGIGFKRFFSDAVLSGNSIWKCGNGITFEDFSAITAGMYPKRINISGLTLRDIGYIYRGEPNLAERGISISRADDIIFTGISMINVSGDGIFIDNGKNIDVVGCNIDGYLASPNSAGNNGIHAVLLQSGSFINVNVKNVNDNAAYFRGVSGVCLSGGRYVSSGTKSGIRVNAQCVFSRFHPDYVSGGSGLDVEWYRGATGIIGEYLAEHGVGPAKYGYQVITRGSGTTPNSIATPRYVGEHCFVEANNSYWKSFGMNIDNWVKIST